MEQATDLPKWFSYLGPDRQLESRKSAITQLTQSHDQVTDNS
jgi:hypothetical protein